MNPLRSFYALRRLAGSRWMATVWMHLVLAAVSTRPASAQYQIFWGDVHGHTSHSDGKGSLDDYFTYARDVAKLDFVIVTDHDFGNGKPTWRMPKETWTLTQNKADEYTVDGKPRLSINVQGTAEIQDVAIVRDGSIVHSLQPQNNAAKFEYVDDAFQSHSYYYVRVTQADADEHGNLSRAWSSPIWVTSKR